MLTPIPELHGLGSPEQNIATMSQSHPLSVQVLKLSILLQATELPAHA
ncbi:MAG: hypothetical protein ABI548_15240 [Polyangiaceae bacterium]